MTICGQSVILVSGLWSGRSPAVLTTAFGENPVLTAEGLGYCGRAVTLGLRRRGARRQSRLNGDMAKISRDPSSKFDGIVDAADRLFVRFGYRRTSMDDVAGEAGVAKGTLYLYFASKDALFRAVLARNLEAAERLCDAARAEGGDLAAQIFGQLEAWFGTVVDHYGASGHLSELSAARTAVGKEAVETPDRTFEARLIALIDAAVVEGRGTLDRTGLTSGEIVAPLLAAARGAKYRHGVSVTPDAYRASLRSIAQVFAAAIGPS